MARTTLSRTRVGWGRGAAALALTLVPGFGGCGGDSADAADLTLRTSTVTRGTLESSVEATGTVEPIRVVEVRSQASGEILRMPVELGDRVERGSLLLEIDPRNEVNELQQAQADLEQAEAELGVAESRLERVRSLRDSGVVTTEELETATVQHANAQSAHVRATTRLGLAREQRADASVRAPITGTIVEKGVEEGQVVTGTRDLTGGTVLMRLADLSNVQVRTLVDESEIGGVEPGLQAAINVEAYRDRTFRGEVLQVEPRATVQENVTMFAVLTRIPNPEGLLRPGMNADVEIVLGRKDDVLKLSNSGLKLPGEARQLVSALGMDPGLLEQRMGSSGGAGEAGSEEGEPPARRPGRDAPADDGDNGPRFRSRGDRSAQAGPPAGGQGQGPGARPAGDAAVPGPDARGGADAGSRPAFVFVRDENGDLTLKAVRVGLSSWEETEIVGGLAEGDTVVNVPLALVQQSEMLQRFRGRGGIPGIGGS